MTTDSSRTSAISEKSTIPTDLAEVEELVTARVPVVYRGAAADFRLLEGSDGDAVTLLGKLSRLIGSQSVSVTTGKKENGGVLGYGGFDGHRAIPSAMNYSMNFSRFVEQVVAFAKPEAEEFVYLQSHDVGTDTPNLLPYLNLPVTAVAPTLGGRWNLWVGSGDHHVNLHYDHESNFLCLLAGQKTVTLLPPDVLPDIYIGPLDGGPFFAPASLVDPANPDLERFPRYANAIRRSSTVELHSGDIIYIPSHWWHHVRSTGINIAVNYWWNDIEKEMADRAFALFLQSLLCLRSLPSEWREIWNIFFQHFVFQSNGDPYLHLPPENQGYAGHSTPEREAMIQKMLSAILRGTL